MEDESKFGASLLGRYLKGRYQLTGIMAEGPRSVVFRAKQLDLDRDVAVKLLALRSSEFPELGQRLARTVHRAVKVRHRGVAEMYEHAVTDSGFNFVAMELLSGISLRRLLKDGPLTPAEAVEIGASIGSALGALHAEGIVHNNLSVSGVFLVPNHGGGRDIKLIGVGMAMPMAFSDVEKDANARRTLLGLAGAAKRERPAVFYGTPEALCPELAYGAEPDVRADVYALGVLMYWMLCGSPPFSAPTWEALVARHLADLPDPLGSRVRGVPVKLERAVMRALQKDPAARFTTVAEFCDELWRGLIPDDEPVLPVVNRRRAVGVGVFCGAVALLAFGFLLTRQRQPTPAEPPVLARPATSALGETSPATTRDGAGLPEPSTREAPPPTVLPEPVKTKTRARRLSGAPSTNASPPEPPPNYSLDEDLKEYR
ncbi:MAG: protein kinase [Myxococcales bacterium]|nr:protein kinase [Myxococcales bacterium]